MLFQDAADLRQLTEYDIAERALGVVRDADGDYIAFGFRPLMILGVFQFFGKAHVLLLR